MKTCNPPMGLVQPSIGWEGAKEYLTKPELAARLNKTPRTVEAWMAQGLIPFVKLNRSVLFHWESVVEAINSRMQGTR